MKQILLFFALLLTIVSCSDSIHNSEESHIQNGDDQVQLREDDCSWSFTPGNVWEGLFGDIHTSTGFLGDWEGTFESEYFPCPIIKVDPGDCCNETIIVDQLSLIPSEFYTSCNTDLDAVELESLAEDIWAIAMANRPWCNNIKLNPWAIDVMITSVLCCAPPYDTPPCTEYIEDPCECFNEKNADDVYWGCCRSYQLQLAVRYARLKPCPDEEDN